MLKIQVLPVFLFCISVFCGSTAYAVNLGAEIKNAELTLHGDSYELSANMDYRLSEPTIEALQNGVPLFWDLHIKVRQARDFLWDITLLEKTIRYRIQYHALLNMYRIRNEGTGDVDNFSTLSSALDLISNLDNFRLMDKSALAPDIAYYVEMKIIFDREALPLPLRPMAYLNSKWYLSSDWFVWPLTK